MILRNCFGRMMDAMKQNLKLTLILISEKPYRILEMLDPVVLSDCKTIIIRSAQGTAPNDPNTPIYTFEINKNELQITDPVSFRKLFIENYLKEFDKLCGEMTASIVFVDMNDLIGTAISPLVMKNLARRSLPLFLFAQTPKQTAGRKKVLTSRMALEEIYPHVVGFVSECGDSAEGDLFAQINTLLGAVLAKDEIHRDISWIENNGRKINRLVILEAKTSGLNRAQSAVKSLLNDERLRSLLSRPAGILLHYQAGRDLTLMEIDKSATEMVKGWGAEIDLSFSVTFNDELHDELKIGLIVKSLKHEEQLLNGDFPADLSFSG